jgi:undecaprenyl diphosphate synthase
MKPVTHVGIIMDGNGRWAEQKGLPRWKGHEIGAQAVRRITEAACRHGIPILSLFAFSSENWKRPTKEIRVLFSLLHRYLLREKQALIKNDVRFSAFGRRDRIPALVREAIAVAEDETRNGRKLHLRVALDYGARFEITEAARSLARMVAERSLDPEQITEDVFCETLSSIPDPDLIIRTAGEQRLSNFLLWQAAYSELYFSPKLWPDFSEDDLEQALACYSSRTRKFGALAQATGTSG